MIIWISSYPKSGNTWLRSLISNYFFSDDGNFSFELIKQIDSFPSSKFFKNYQDKFEKPEDTSKYWIKEQEKINLKNKIFFLKRIMHYVKLMATSSQIQIILWLQFI